MSRPPSAQPEASDQDEKSDQEHERQQRQQKRLKSPSPSLAAPRPQPSAEPLVSPPQQQPTVGEVEDGSSNRINVVVRCRPLSVTEHSNHVQDLIRVMDKRLVILLDPGAAVSNDYLRQDKTREKRYAFDQAFGQNTSTLEVFEASTKPLVKAVLEAYNATVFAYGSTGAGKTFTMIGTPEEPGVMVHTVSTLFERAKDVRQGPDDSSGSSVAIRCSFIEVYNENLFDLLIDDGSPNYLDLREDPVKGTCVAGVTEVEAETAKQVMDLLQEGNRRRTTEPTAMNVTSSRSHAVLQVTVEQRDLQACNAITQLGKLSMIDLAGSERASQTDNRGVRLIEGANINRSLLALGNCINALASGSSFVPYRDSKLTRLLKNSLGGNCKTVMVANISPSHLTFEDTLNTLKYANRAKNIRVSAKQNLIQPDSHVSQYEKAIEDLRSEVQLLKAKLAQRGEAVPSLVLTMPGADQNALKEASAHWKAEVVHNLEVRTQLQRSLIEVERGLVQWRTKKARVQKVIEQWDTIAEASATRGRPITPSSSSIRTPALGVTLDLGGARPGSLAEWEEQLLQIDECIRENMEARRSLAERFEQNKTVGKELQAQLPHGLLTEDLRAFLGMIQRVQVLEVERLELDHTRETQQVQLDERDEEITMLREQLRLRNAHLRAQRELISAEKRKQLPVRLSLLTGTFADATPPKQHGPLRVMHAWAPPPLEHDDGRTARERPAPISTSHADTEAKDNLPPLSCGVQGIDWKNVEVPRAPQLRDMVNVQPATAVRHQQQQQQRQPQQQRHAAAKGWHEPPELRIPLPPQQPMTRQPPLPLNSHVTAGVQLPNKPATGPAGGQQRRSSCGRSPAKRRGNTCPPLPAAGLGMGGRHGRLLPGSGAVASADRKLEALPTLPPKPALGRAGVDVRALGIAAAPPAPHRAVANANRGMAHRPRARSAHCLAPRLGQASRMR